MTSASAQSTREQAEAADKHDPWRLVWHRPAPADSTIQARADVPPSAALGAANDKQTSKEDAVSTLEVQGRAQECSSSAD